ncbi:EcsC family protein [Cytobacillus depressus]|uniref:EcsC family protein n=1 Tax=Cytobacillus depressus TaxID=1602942 RepID=A0A6L3V953_9BACI|nr:EcsC family protein [Cytobacillus depressus]KAB2338140.1 EcsC family protein [Cytobacillus depressus]
METREQLIHELKKCEDWEKSQSGIWFWEKIGRLPFKLLDKMTPIVIQKKIGVILDELGNYIQSGGRYLSSMSSLKKHYPHKRISKLEDLNHIAISEMDTAVSKLTKNRKRFATIQGASTGVGGILTLSIDIPVLLGIQLKTLQDLAICYGFDPNDKKERMFIVKILQFVSSDIVGKKAILKQLSAIDSPNDKGNREVISEIQGWREVVFTYRDHIGWKKLFQMIPVAGLLFGAFINRSAVNDIAEAGMMLYRKRRIKERLTVNLEKI